MDLEKEKRSMVIKVDLEKSSDRLSWSFILDTHKEVGFPNDLVSLIMNCITTVFFQVLWNGSQVKDFRSSRSIWQGDLLSLYIFILYLERLTHLINDKVT